VGDFIGEGLIRSPQIQEKTLDADRLTDHPVEVLASFFGVDLTIARTVPLYTVPTGKVLIPLGLLFEATDATSVTAFPTVSVGISPSTVNIFPVETMEEFDITGDTWTNWLMFSHARAGVGGNIVTIDITAATATTLVSKIHFIGFLV